MDKIIFQNMSNYKTILENNLKTLVDSYKNMTPEEQLVLFIELVEQFKGLFENINKLFDSKEMNPFIQTKPKFNLFKRKKHCQECKMLL